MSHDPDPAPDPAPAQDRRTQHDATPGQDPRDIDHERTDPEQVERLDQTRHVSHTEQETGEEMGTSSTTRDPTEGS